MFTGPPALRTYSTPLKNSLVNSAGITFIISASQLLTWFITTQRLPAIISDWIVTTITSPTVFLLVIMGIFFVAGCFMELVALMIILGPILSPTLASYGVDPIHFGIICVMAAQVSYLTPPFGMNLFVTMNMTKRSLGYVSKSRHALSDYSDPVHAPDSLCA